MSADILLFYFDERHIKTALSIAMVGIGVGWLAFPVIAQYIFDKVGFKMGMLILASFNLVQTLAAIAYVETESYPKSRSSTEENSLLPKTSSSHSLTSKMKKLSRNFKVRLPVNHYSIIPVHYFVLLPSTHQVFVILLLIFAQIPADVHELSQNDNENGKSPLHGLRCKAYY